MSEDVLHIAAQQDSSQSINDNSEVQGQDRDINQEKQEDNLFISSQGDGKTIIPTLKIPTNNDNKPSSRDPDIQMSTYRIYSEEELDEELRKLLKTKEVPILEVRKQLLQHISRKKVEAIAQSDYEQGEKLCNAEEILRSAISKNAQEAEQRYETNSVGFRLRQAKSELEQAQKEWDEKLREIEDQQNEKLNQILAKQEQDEKDFQIFWKDPKSFHNFNKPSAQLLQLRQIEKRLAITGEFAEAKSIKKRADQLEAVETKRAQEKALQGMKITYEAMERKHAQEISAHERNTNKLKLGYEARRKETIKPLEMAVKKLELQKASPRTPRKISVVSRAKIQRSPNDDFDDQPAITTPRTAKKLNRLRDHADPQTLQVKGIEVRKYVKPKQKVKPESPRKPKKADDF